MYKGIKNFVYHGSAFLFAVATVIAFAQVFCRYVLNSSIYWAEEIIRYLFVWMFFLGAAEACRTGSHIGVDLLISKLKNNKQNILHNFIDIIDVIFLCIVTYLGFKITLINMGQKSPALLLPMGIVFLAIPVGSILMIFFIIRNIHNRKESGNKKC